jgi:hypothetical protein
MDNPPGPPAGGTIIALDFQGAHREGFLVPMQSKSAFSSMAIGGTQPWAGVQFSLATNNGWLQIVG